MNQYLLGALRGVGCLLLFTILTALIGALPDALTQLPYIGQFATPVISGAIVAAAFTWEHGLAVKFGYNLTTTQAGSIRRS